MEAGDRAEAAGAELPGDRPTYRCPMPCSPETYVLRVRDVSMVPRFREGDLLFVDPRLSPETPRYVVARSEGSGEAIFRQLVESGGRRYLCALKPDWSRPVVEATGDERVCVVVVFRGRKIRRGVWRRSVGDDTGRPCRAATPDGLGAGDGNCHVGGGRLEVACLDAEGDDAVGERIGVGPLGLLRAGVSGARPPS